MWQDTKFLFHATTAQNGRLTDCNDNGCTYNAYNSFSMGIFEAFQLILSKFICYLRVWLNIILNTYIRKYP